MNAIRMKKLHSVPGHNVLSVLLHSQHCSAVNSTFKPGIYALWYSYSSCIIVPRIWQANLISSSDVMQRFHSGSIYVHCFVDEHQSKQFAMVKKTRSFEYTVFICNLHFSSGQNWNAVCRHHLTNSRKHKLEIQANESMLRNTSFLLPFPHRFKASWLN